VYAVLCLIYLVLGFLQKSWRIIINHHSLLLKQITSQILQGVIIKVITEPSSFFSLISHPSYEYISYSSHRSQQMVFGHLLDHSKCQCISVLGGSMAVGYATNSVFELV
jgi:hypothetical protein